MQIPFGLSAYSRFNGRMPPVRLVNQYAEGSPTSKSGAVLFQRPGLAALYDRASRGVYRQDGVFEGGLFTVSGSVLYRNNTALGSVAGSDRVEFAYTVDGLFVLSGGVVYQYDGSTLSQTAFPDGASVASITELDNFLVAVRQDTGTVYFRVPGDTTWNALDFFSAEREPDPAICVRSLIDVLYVFGSASIEAFAPTGSATQPFQRIQGAGFARGCKDKNSVVTLDNTLFFVGEDNIAYRIDNVPVRISDHGQEERFSLSATASCGTYSWQGHKFYVVGLETETLVYDVAGGWSQYVQNGGAFPSTLCFDGSTTYVAGEKIYTLEDRADDDGEVMERIWTSIIPVDEPVSCDAIEIGLSPGVTPLGTEPAVVQTRISRDQGRTWGDWREASTGFGGEYRKRVRIRRWGMLDAPGALFEHRITDPVELRISDMSMNPTLGGRSRG